MKSQEGREPADESLIRFTILAAPSNFREYIQSRRPSNLGEGGASWPAISSQVAMGSSGHQRPTRRGLLRPAPPTSPYGGCTPPLVGSTTNLLAQASRRLAAPGPETRSAKKSRKSSRKVGGATPPIPGAQPG